MSHFSTLVILPTDALDIEAEVAKRLAPYDENMEVDSYFVECWCRNSKARSFGFNEAERLAPKTLDQYRESYWKIEGEKPDWEQYIAEWKFIADEAEKRHPLCQKFDPDCDECAGSGTRSTTRNPKSKWDWWQIGGRWTGALDGDYDPCQDIENQEWCKVCDGTGNRTDFEYYADPNDIEKTVFSPSSAKALAAMGIAQSAETTIPPGYRRVEWCNGCSGKGFSVKWPTEWAKFEGDIKAMNRIDLKFRPFAIVTPDNEWLEKGEMGWFACVADEKGDDEWNLCVEATFEKYLDCIGVLVDCHI